MIARLFVRWTRPSVRANLEEMSLRPDAPPNKRYESREDRYRYALRRLTEIGWFAVPTLVDALNDERPEVRSAAANGLRAIGFFARAAFRSLQRGVDKDSSPEVRFAIVAAMESVAPRRSVKPLIRALAIEKCDAVRSRIVDALGRIGNSRTVPVLVNAFKAIDGTKQRELRESTVRALARLKDPRAIPVVVEAALDDDRGYTHDILKEFGINWAHLRDAERFVTLVPTLKEAGVGQTILERIDRENQAERRQAQERSRLATQERDQKRERLIAAGVCPECEGQMVVVVGERYVYQARSQKIFDRCPACQGTGRY